MKESGFGHVAWTDGKRPEAKTVRIIAGFPRPILDAKSKDNSRVTLQASVESLVYKRFGDTEIHADVYYPLSPEDSSKKMPVGKSAEL